MPPQNIFTGDAELKTFLNKHLPDCVAKDNCHSYVCYKGTPEKPTKTGIPCDQVKINGVAGQLGHSSLPSKFQNFIDPAKPEQYFFREPEIFSVVLNK